MKLEYLAENTDKLPLIAEWYHSEWGHLSPDRSRGSVEESMRKYLNTDCVPLIVLAKDGDRVIGAAQLKFHEMDIYTDKEHWLGGVYVDKPYRGNGVARQIIEKILHDAKKFGVKKLYLQTIREDGGLYAKMGWELEESVVYREERVFVMVKDLAG